jgi:hypothetical protein
LTERTRRGWGCQKNNSKKKIFFKKNGQPPLTKNIGYVIYIINIKNVGGVRDGKKKGKGFI